MKKYLILVLTLILLLTAAAAFAAGDGVETRRAMLIGNELYTKMTRLFGPVNDAGRMATVLKSSRFDGVPCARAECAYNLTNAQLLDKAAEMTKWGIDDDDVTVYYFSGHGDTKDPKNPTASNSGIYGVDASDTLKFTDLEQALSKIPGTVIVMFDSCHSGGAIDKAVSPRSWNNAVISAFSSSGSKGTFAQGKYKVITASSGTTISESSYVAGVACGIFTYNLVVGGGVNFSRNSITADMPADKDGNGVVTLNEAYAYAKDMTRRTNAQVAQVYPENSDFALFARTDSKAITLDKKSLTLREGGEKALLIATLKPAGADGEILWLSSNVKVATVDQKGLVTAVGKGKCKITAARGTAKAECAVKVKQIALKSFELETKALTLAPGERKTVTAEFKPANSTRRALKWTIDKKHIATVADDGTITALREGTARITAKAQNGLKRKLTLTVTRAVPLAGFTLSQSALNLTEGFSKELSVEFDPANASDKTIIWSSSDENVAQVSAGVITAKSAGKADITAASASGVKRVCAVTVVENSVTFTYDKDPMQWEDGYPYAPDDHYHVTCAKLSYKDDELVCDMLFGFTPKMNDEDWEGKIKALKGIYVYVRNMGTKGSEGTMLFDTVPLSNIADRKTISAFTVKIPIKEVGLLDLTKGGYKAYVPHIGIIPA